MINPRTITIIKSKTGLRQVQFTHIVIGEFSTLDEAKEFAKNYEHGSIVKIWDNDSLIEEFDK